MQLKVKLQKRRNVNGVDLPHHQRMMCQMMQKTELLVVLDQLHSLCKYDIDSAAFLNISLIMALFVPMTQ